MLPVSLKEYKNIKFLRYKKPFSKKVIKKYDRCPFPKWPREMMQRGNSERVESRAIEKNGLS
jgi:hypothetical protein